jgi:hypothetical protein
MKKTILVRLSLDEASATPLETRIQELCDLQYYAGFRLASTFIDYTELVLIFQYDVNLPSNAGTA